MVVYRAMAGRNDGTPVNAALVYRWRSVQLDGAPVASSLISWTGRETRPAFFVGLFFAKNRRFAPAVEIFDAFCSLSSGEMRWEGCKLKVQPTRWKETIAIQYEGCSLRCGFGKLNLSSRWRNLRQEMTP